MRTVRHNDTTHAVPAGCWKIFPDIILNEFESLSTPYFKLNDPLIIDDLPNTTDKAKLTTWFSKKLYEAIQKDPASEKRVDILSVSSEPAFYTSFWRSSVMHNCKFYINSAIPFTSALTVLFTYLRLSQPTATSADALSRYAQENSANITAKAFALVSAAMMANNLTLPSNFLNMTLNTLTTEILNQNVVYLRQESQASANTTLYNILALSVGIVAACLIIYEKLIVPPELINKFEEDRFTKLISPVQKCVKEIAEELALKHSVVYGIIDFLNEGSQDTSPAEPNQKSATTGKGKEEDQPNPPQMELMEPYADDLERGTQRVENPIDSKASSKLFVERLLIKFDKTLSLKSYQQAKIHLDKINDDPTLKFFIFEIFKHKFTCMEGQNITIDKLVDPKLAKVVVEVFGSIDTDLAIELFKLLSFDRKHARETLSNAICTWADGETPEGKKVVAEIIANLSTDSKVAFRDAVKVDMVDDNFIRNCVERLIEGSSTAATLKFD